MKVKWNIDDVISYLESKILYDEATDREISFYNQYIWDNKKINTNGTLYKKLIKKMNQEYYGEE